MFFIFLISCNSGKEITEDELKDHISYLASDSLKGRLTGSEGDSLAALYIRDELASYGFKPVSDDGFQRFRVNLKMQTGPENSLSIDGEHFILGTDFIPSAFSSNSGLIAQAVFAGYGFNINTDSLQWNDYRGIEVKDKWVMLLRADPDVDKPVSRFSRISSDRDKALLAKDMGAAGILLVSGESYDPLDLLEKPDNESSSLGIPVIRIKRDIADRILQKSKNRISDIEKKINSSGKPVSFPTGIIVSGKAELLSETGNTRNVVMMLEGEDAGMRDEFLIIGAHFDHLGLGGQGSASRAVDTIAIHHGADDNASGVGAMLEIAEKFAHTTGSHPRNIVCIAFSAEEKGLLGSKYFVENPMIDLKKVNAMLNLDMLGRLQETNTVQISGAGTAKGIRDLISSLNDTSLLNLTITDEGYGPSDHSSFYGKNIPVLFFSTGAHLDYHTPYDTYDKINYGGMVKVTDYIFKIAQSLASQPEMLEFRESGPAIDQQRQMRRRGVTIGIMPDFAGNVKNGLRADFVSPGRPAALGGMKKGDIIKAINGKSVNNIEDYMFRMNQLSPGQTINIEVLRDTSTMLLIIQL
jgi:hypothetical protein